MCPQARLKPSYSKWLVSVSGLTLLAVVGACARTAGSNEQQLLDLAAKSSTRLKAQNGSAADSLTKRNAEATERLLRGLIDKEREERKEADQQLSARIDKLESELVAFKQEVNAKFALVDKRDSELRAELTANFEELKKVDAVLAANLEKESKARAAELTDVRNQQARVERDFTDKLQASEKSFADKLIEQKAEFETAVKSSKATIEKEVADLNSKMQTATEESKQALNAQKAVLEARIANIEAAAKSERERLDKTVAQMDADRKALDAKIDSTTAELEKAKKDLAAQIASASDAQRIALETNVRLLEKKVSDLGDDLKRENLALAARQSESEKKISDLDARLAAETKARQEAMAALKSETEELIKKTDSATQTALRSLIAQAEQTSASNLTKLQGDIADRMSKQDAATRLELLSLATKIAEVAEEGRSDRKALEAKLTSDIENVRGDLNAKSADLNAALSAARTELASKITSGLSGLSDEFSQKLIAAEGRLSENLQKEVSAQRIEIESLKVGLQKAEDKFATDIAAKGKELEGKLEELKVKVDAGFSDIYSRHFAETLKNQETTAALSKVIAEQQAALAASESSYTAQLSALATSQQTALQDALKAEREERIAELNKLNSDLTTLKTAQETARSNLKKELEDNIKAMGDKTAEEKAQMELRILELNGALEKLDESTFATMKDLKDNLAVERQKTEAQIATAVGKIEEKLAQAAVETAKVSARVEAVNRAQEEFKTYVAQTYATKGELEAIALRVDGLKFVTDVMNSDMTKWNKEMRDIISAEVTTAKNELATRIGKVEISVDGLKVQLGGAIDDYKTKIDKMSESIKSEISIVRTDMKSQDDALLAKLSDNESLSTKANADLMEKLKKQAIDFEALTQGVKKELSDKLVLMDGQISATNTDLQLAKLETQQKFADAVKREQDFKDQFAKDIAALKLELEATAKESSQALALATANSESINLLRTDFDDHKTYALQKFKLTDIEMEKVNTSITKMKDDFNVQLAKAAEDAKTLVENLGTKVQDQFATVTTDIAKIKVAQRAQEAKLVNHYVEMFKLDWDAGVEEFSQGVSEDQSTILVKKEMKNGKEVVTGRGPLVRTLLAFTELRKSFLAALQPKQRKDGEDRIEFYDKSFVPIMVQCGGNAQATFANAFGRDSFDYMADAFIAGLIMESRGSAVDVMYLKNDKLTDGDSLHHYVLLEALRNLDGMAEDAQCMTQIKSWAREVLNSKEFASSRDSIAKNVDFQGRMAEFVASSAELKTAMDKLEKRFANRIFKNQTKIGKSFSKISDSDIEKLFGKNARAQDKAVELLAQMANTISDSADATYDAIERQAEFNKMVDMQRQFAAAMKEENAGDAKIEAEANTRATKMETRITALENSLAKFNTLSTDVANLNADVGNMKNSLSRALDVVMSLAIRGGHPDLVDATKEAGKFINYSPKQIGIVKPKILEVQHFFAAPALQNGSDTCTGATIKRGAGVKFWYSHGATQCWVNFRGIAWNSWASVSQGIWFRVFGAASSLKVWSDNCGSNGPDSCNVTFNYGWGGSAKVSSGKNNVSSTISGEPNEGVFDVRVPDILLPYMNNSRSWYGEGIRFVASGTDGTTASAGYTVQMFSPIVLDFLSVGRPLFSSVEESRVRFDLDADGRQEKVGWLAGNREMGLLALDLNNNGRIDNGGELFGEATLLKKSGKRAKDGYAALAQYDSNKDGFIDHKDKVFGKLVVWFDRNQDGQTNSDELVSLATSGVTKIAVTHSEVNKELRFVNGNEMRTQSKFWGPQQCGAQGCNSYDVYFSAGFMLSEKKPKK